MSWSDCIPLLVLPIAFALDLLLGDPAWMYHPVRWIGKTIALFERSLRKWFPATPRGEFAGGLVMAVLLPLLFTLPTAALLHWLHRHFPPIWLLLEIWLSYRLLAAGSLRKESMAVYRKLAARDLPGARLAVGRIVGRDTDRLDETGIARATVETVAENTSDGVVAPMLFLALGGAALGLWYKAVNTLDSMVGYKNNAYLHFGRASAKQDDLANWLPARLSAGLMIPAAGICGQPMGNAARIYRRDRRNHSSPNAGHTEAVCAGALGIQLGGGNTYFGEYVQKPTIGDPQREITPEDISSANRLMLCTSILSLLLFAGLRLLMLKIALVPHIS